MSVSGLIPRPNANCSFICILYGMSNKAENFYLLQ